jgi:hypothetical protein
MRRLHHNRRTGDVRTANLQLSTGKYIPDVNKSALHMGGHFYFFLVMIVVAARMIVIARWRRWMVIVMMTVETARHRNHHAKERNSKSRTSHLQGKPSCKLRCSSSHAWTGFRGKF